MLCDCRINKRNFGSHELKYNLEEKGDDHLYQFDHEIFILNPIL